MSSRQNPLHLSSCYCYGYRFWGDLSLSRVLWKSAYSRSNMKPKSIPKQLGNGSISCFVGFRCFGNTSCSFGVAFICMHVPSFSFHLHASSFHCAFISFHFLSLVFIYIHFPIIFLSCSFQSAFMSSHLPFMCTQVPFILHSCPFISFLKLWRWLSGLAREPLQHMTLFEGNLPQNDRPRERESGRERERASWMPNAMVTAGNTGTTG